MQYMPEHSLSTAKVPHQFSVALVLGMVCHRLITSSRDGSALISFDDLTAKFFAAFRQIVKYLTDHNRN